MRQIAHAVPLQGSGGVVRGLGDARPTLTKASTEPRRLDILSRVGVRHREEIEPEPGAIRAIGLDFGCGHEPAQGDLVCFVAADKRWTPELRLALNSGSADVFCALPQCIGVALPQECAAENRFWFLVTAVRRFFTEGSGLAGWALKYAPHTSQTPRQQEGSAK